MNMDKYSTLHEAHRREALQFVPSRIFINEIYFLSIQCNRFFFLYLEFFLSLQSYIIKLITKCFQIIKAFKLEKILENQFFPFRIVACNYSVNACTIENQSKLKYSICLLLNATLRLIKYLVYYISWFSFLAVLAVDTKFSPMLIYIPVLYKWRPGHHSACSRNFMWKSKEITSKSKLKTGTEIYDIVIPFDEEIKEYISINVLVSGHGLWTNKKKS